LAAVNYQLFHLLNSGAGRFDGLDDVMEFMATWLIYLVFAIAAALVAAELYRRRLRPVLELGSTLVLAFAAATLLSMVSREVRPFQTHPVHQLIAHDPGASLPSDHATAAFAVAFGVGLFLSRGWGVLLAVLAIAIGFSRIWVGVHYPGDIVAAVVIAGLAAAEVAVWSRWRRDPARAGTDLPAARGAS
jgi:undecaprenyl-diphosphatase